MFSRAILSTTFLLDLKNSFLHDSDWISFFLFHVQSRKWIWKPEATKNKWILRENIFYLHPCSVRVHVVVLCPDTLHPLLSFAFRKGILDLHVTREFWKKDLEGGRRDLFSLSCFFPPTYMDSHGGSKHRSPFLGGLS